MQLLVPFYLVLSIIITALYANERAQYGKNVVHFFSFCLFLFFILFVSFRDFDHKGDTDTYLRVFNYLTNIDFFSTNIDLRIERGFVFLTAIIGRISDENRFFLFSITIIQAVFWYVCFCKWVERKNVLICILIFISLFSSYNLGANALRQAIAIPIGLIGLKFLLERKLLFGVLLILLGTLFHKSVFLVLLSWMLTTNKVQIKNYIYIWLSFTVLSISGVFSGVVNYIKYDFESYSHLAGDAALERYQTGFRIDFWMFSVIPLILFYFLKQPKKDEYSQLMKIYITIFSFFILMFEIPYSDRVGLYTWTMFPILCSLFIGNYRLPILNSNLLTTVLITILGLLSFQLYPIMNIGTYFTDIF